MSCWGRDLRRGLLELLHCRQKLARVGVIGSKDVPLLCKEGNLLLRRVEELGGALDYAVEQAEVSPEHLQRHLGDCRRARTEVVFHDRVLTTPDAVVPVCMCVMQDRRRQTPAS